MTTPRACTCHDCLVKDWRAALDLLATEARRAHVDPAHAATSRDRACVLVRWRTWRELRRMRWSYPRIARAFGVDHTTVMHAVKSGEPVITETRPCGAA